MLKICIKRFVKDEQEAYDLYNGYVARIGLSIRGNKEDMAKMEIEEHLILHVQKKVYDRVVNLLQ